MGFFDDDEAVKKEPEIQVKYTNMDKVLEEANIKMELTERAKKYGDMLLEAKSAFKYADLTPTVECCKEVATSWLIDEGKNNRTTTIKEAKEQAEVREEKVEEKSDLPKCQCGAHLVVNKYKTPENKQPNYKCLSCKSAAWVQRDGSLYFKAGN